MQAPDDEVEGCILHVDDNQDPTAILCRGHGSFDKNMKEIQQSHLEDEASQKPSEEREAATV